MIAVARRRRIYFPRAPVLFADAAAAPLYLTATLHITASLRQRQSRATYVFRGTVAPEPTFSRSDGGRRFASDDLLGLRAGGPPARRGRGRAGTHRGWAPGPLRPERRGTWRRCNGWQVNELPPPQSRQWH